MFNQQSSGIIPSNCLVDLSGANNSKAHQDDAPSRAATVVSGDVYLCHSKAILPVPG